MKKILIFIGLQVYGILKSIGTGLGCVIIIPFISLIFAIIILWEILPFSMLLKELIEWIKSNWEKAGRPVWPG